MYKDYNLDKGIKNQTKPKSYVTYLLLFAIGLIIFFTVTFTFSFKDKVFQAFFQRPFSFAQSADGTPKVDLIAGVDNSFKRGVVNVENGKSNISLKWKTENTPQTCIGRFWSNLKKSDPWVGVKNTKGGDYLITDSLQTGIYVYSIDCSNEFGDATGSNITINVGAKPSYLQPHITSFQVFGDDNYQYSPGKPNVVSQNTKLNITWTSINMETQYGICVADGSWPTIYKNTGNLQIKESFTLELLKIYNYSIFCSNENGYDRQEISFIVR